MNANSRISQKFQQLKSQNQCGFIGYLCAGDPDYSTSLSAIKNLAKNGVDLIEIGVPFLDPAGDGPTIELASKRAIASGMDLNKTLKLVAEFRQENHETPVILMTYFNPVLKFGLDKIFSQAKIAGVDGFLIVDLPLEERSEVLLEIQKNQLDFIALIAPTTPISRAEKILQNASGFVYLISMLGITGTKLAETADNEILLKKIREITNLPIAIGFGIQQPKQASNFKNLGVDAVVIGSTLVKELSLDIEKNQMLKNLENKVLEFKTAIKS